MAKSVFTVNIWNKSMSGKHVAIVIEINSWNAAIVFANIYFFQPS